MGRKRIQGSCEHRPAGMGGPAERPKPQAGPSRNAVSTQSAGGPASPQGPSPQEDLSAMAIAPQRSEIGIRRHYTTEGVHPYDQVTWERRDARITNFRDGSVAFEQLGVEVCGT